MIASLFNLAGPDLFVLLGLWALIAMIVIFARRRSRERTGLSTGLPVEQRLRRLDQLKARGVISITEYNAQRQKIISQL